MTLAQSSRSRGRALLEQVKGAFAETPWQAYLLLLPAVSLIAILFGGGLILAFLQSVSVLGLTTDGTLSSSVSTGFEQPCFLAISVVEFIHCPNSHCAVYGSEYGTGTLVTKSWTLG